MMRINMTIHEELFLASQNGDIERVNQLLAEGADIEARNENGTTALMIAAFLGHTATMQALLAQGADIDAKDAEGYDALLYAVENGHIANVQALLVKGADIEASNENRPTALIHAARCGHTEVVQALLDKGADINAKDNRGWTALLRAADFGYDAIVQALLAAGAVITAYDARYDFFKPYAIIENLAYAQGLALSVGDVRSHAEYYANNVENNKTLHGDDIVSIYQEIQNKEKSKEYKHLAKKTDDLGKFDDVVRLSDLGMTQKEGWGPTLYRLYCAETIYQMDQNTSRDVSILALLKVRYYIESPHRKDLVYAIEILSNFPEMASGYVMQHAQELIEHCLVAGVRSYNEGSLGVSREELQTKLFPNLLDKYLAYGSVLAKDTDIFERLHALHRLERSLASHGVTGHASDAFIPTLVTEALIGKDSENEGEKDPERCLEQALQVLDDALAARDNLDVEHFVFNNAKVDNLDQVSAVVVHQLIDQLPKDSYTKAREVAEKNFYLSLRTDQASLRELDGLNHLGIFAQSPCKDDGLTKPENGNNMLNAKL